MRIGITGAHGFLGWHLRCYLHGAKNAQTVPAGRGALGDLKSCLDFVNQCDVIVHLAGVNRGTEAEVYDGNIEAATRLTEALRLAKVRPAIVFASSTHIAGDSNYGRAKKMAQQILETWGSEADVPVCTLVLPHLFGEGGRPFYNSVTATFCYQLANGQTPKIINDIPLSLLHARRVCERIMQAIERRDAGQFQVPGTDLAVSELLPILTRMRDQYVVEKTVPELAGGLDLELFNTLRSYLYPAIYPVQPEIRTDNRGGLFEAIRAKREGQTFISTTHPGITRGNHYHHYKIERFCVIQGEAEIRIRRLFDKQVVSFRVNGNTPTYIDMPTYHTHNITNVGKRELITLFWSHECFDPNQPDTYGEPVESESPLQTERRPADTTPQISVETMQ